MDALHFVTDLQNHGNYGKPPTNASVNSNKVVIFFEKRVAKGETLCYNGAKSCIDTKERSIIFHETTYRFGNGNCFGLRIGSVLCTVYFGSRLQYGDQ